ncbi:MAG: sulfatase-like hydrolase/transferase, partial [Anaerolineae bacterium]
TGLYPHQVDMMENSNTLRADPVLSNLLREHGYHLDYAGKWHLGDEVISSWFDRCVGYSITVEDYSEWCRENGLPDGWAFNDHSLRTHRTPHMSIPVTAVMPLEPSQTNEAWITDHAIRFFRTRPKDRPFFLVCGYNGPHPPFKVPEPYYSMYDPRDIPEPPNFKPSPHKPRANATSFYHQLWLDHSQDWEAWKKSVAVYWGFVTMIDDQIGRLLRSLEEEGILDDTLIIFTSDHGEFLGQHGLWHKMHAYEEAIRVPLVLRHPREAGAGVRSRMGASLIDIVPTILSVAGIEPPDNIAGIDLSPAFNGNATYQTNRILFSEHQALGEWHRAVDWRLVTDNRFKYVWNQEDLDELYDLLADPHERFNLIDDPATKSMIIECRALLRRWMQETSDPLLANFETETGTASG